MREADPQAAAIEQLRDELRLTREAMARTAAEAGEVSTRNAGAEPDRVVVYGAGAIVHAFYTAVERFLQAVARDFNAEPPQGADWHRRLLIAASSVRPRRPAVLSRETAVLLDRCLRFRHLFRNLYVFNLDWTEIVPLLLSLPQTQAAADADLARFDGFLQSLLEPLDAGRDPDSGTGG